MVFFYHTATPLFRDRSESDDNSFVAAIDLRHHPEDRGREEIKQTTLHFCLATKRQAGEVTARDPAPVGLASIPEGCRANRGSTSRHDVPRGRAFVACVMVSVSHEDKTGRTSSRLIFAAGRLFTVGGPREPTSSWRRRPTACGRSSSAGDANA